MKRYQSIRRGEEEEKIDSDEEEEEKKDSAYDQQLIKEAQLADQEYNKASQDFLNAILEQEKKQQTPSERRKIKISLAERRKADKGPLEERTQREISLDNRLQSDFKQEEGQRLERQRNEKLQSLNQYKKGENSKTQLKKQFDKFIKEQKDFNFEYVDPKILAIFDELQNEVKEGNQQLVFQQDALKEKKNEKEVDITYYENIIKQLKDAPPNDVNKLSAEEELKKIKDDLTIEQDKINLARAELKKKEEQLLENATNLTGEELQNISDQIELRRAMPTARQEWNELIKEGEEGTKLPKIENDYSLPLEERAKELYSQEKILPRIGNYLRRNVLGYNTKEEIDAIKMMNKIKKNPIGRHHYLSKDEEHNLEEGDILIENESAEAVKDKLEDDDELLETLTEKAEKLLHRHVVCLAVSHNNRLKCIIDKLFEYSNQRKSFQENFYKIKYKNCCILRVDMFYTSGTSYKFQVQMVYSGELNKKDIDKSTQYWTVENPDIETRTKKKFFGFIKGKEVDKYIKFPTFIGIVDLNKLNDLNNIKSNLNLNYFGNENSYTFFLCRHGEGIHNTMSFTKKVRNYSSVLNAPLTNTGKEQAIYAGEMLNNYLQPNKLKINFLFASDLQRTQYTLGEIISSVNPENLQLDYNEIYILPCSHEIVGKKGNCDNVGDFTSNENKATKTGVVEIDGLFLNWNYYDSNFSRIKGGIKSEKCRNTNMFSQMIIMINSRELEELEDSEESLFGDTSLLKLRGGKTKNRKQKRKASKRKATKKKVTKRKLTKRKNKTQKRN